MVRPVIYVLAGVNGAGKSSVGGHLLQKIRQRYTSSRANLIALLPHLADLRVFDNSAPAAADGTVPDPILLLVTQKGRIRYPDLRDVNSLRHTPDWAKPLVEAAILLYPQKRK